ncbi:MAG: hypothetical protein HY519_01095 [Candidatus Aenigmarchaeota archaeon]|nr:hypothetical protein [Candidatus Aenigmarchaeota archaeon]
MFLKRKKPDALPNEQPADDNAASLPAAEPEQIPLGMPGKESPPLFVRVEKYNDILRSISDLKSYSAEIRQSLDILAETEQKLSKGLAASYRNLDALNTIISLLTTRLVSHQRPDAKALAGSDIGHYFKDIHKEMEKLKTELKTV